MRDFLDRHTNTNFILAVPGNHDNAWLGNYLNPNRGEIVGSVSYFAIRLRVQYISVRDAVKQNYPWIGQKSDEIKFRGSFVIK